MSAAEKLIQIQVKIDRAKEYFKSLNDEVATFYETKPYEVTTNRDPKRGLI